MGYRIEIRNGQIYVAGETTPYVKADFWESEGAFINATSKVFQRVLVGKQTSQARKGHWGGGGLHINNIARCNASEGYFRSKRKHGGKPHVFVMMDASGSMGGGHFVHGLPIMAAFNELAYQNKIRFDFVLTGNEKSWWNKSKPVARGLWGLMECRAGCESFAFNLPKYKHIWKTASTFICYTDGAITDGDISPSLWRREGLTCIGAYIGADKQRKQMSKWFDHTLAASNKELLASQLIKLI
jgi:hypothetical protein